MPKAHDGFGGHLELIEVPDSAKSLLEVAEYAAEVVEDLLDYASPAYEQHYKEELAYIRQAIRETREYQLRSELQDRAQLADFA